MDHESTKDANGTIMPAKGEAFNQTGVGLVGRWEGKASAARVEREVEVMRADALPLLNFRRRSNFPQNAVLDITTICAL